MKYYNFNKNKFNLMNNNNNNSNYKKMNNIVYN